MVPSPSWEFGKVTMSVHFFETWRHVYCLMLGKDLEKVKNILPNGGF